MSIAVIRRPLPREDRGDEQSPMPPSGVTATGSVTIIRSSSRSRVILEFTGYHCLMPQGDGYAQMICALLVALEGKA